MTQETLLKPADNRYVLFPIEYDKIWSHYKKQVASFWTAEEVDFSKDEEDWEKLNENERHFIKNVIAFFAASDGIVLENLVERFMNEISIPEVRCFYGFQIAMENIHSETYSLLIDKYIKDEREKNKLFRSIETIDCVKNKAEWAIKWIQDENSNFATRLVAFICVEGIFFSGSFCAIYWLKKRGLMPGLTFSNELISRDEGLHTDFAILLYSMIENRLSEKTIHEIFKEAVNIEKKFIIDSIPCAMIGMNSVLMSDYIEYIADRLLKQLKYNTIYNTKNPFDFMELISMKSKINFFEKRNPDYNMANVNLENKNNKIEFNADF